MRAMRDYTARNCRHISGENPRRGPWTGPYIKLCSLGIAELDHWAKIRLGRSIACCRTCLPARSEVVDSLPRSDSTSPTPSLRFIAQQTAGMSAAEIRGPMPGSPVVEAWIDDYIRFERRPVSQEELRTAIRARVRELTAAPDQVLHATYLGRKHPAADVENLVLYNIDDTGASFANAARFGLRFELGEVAPASPAGKEYVYGYRYELAPRAAGFRHWREARELASWNWIDLGSFPASKRLEQVWIALAQDDVPIASRARPPDTPFVVSVTVRAPRGTTPVLGGLVKAIVDGVVCAFQAHTDRTNVGELAARVSRTLSVSPEAVEALLLNEDRAVLGAAPRLLHLRGDGVIWAPADDLCVAGELLIEPSNTTSWAIKGRVFEVPATVARDDIDVHLEHTAASTDRLEEMSEETNRQGWTPCGADPRSTSMAVARPSRVKQVATVIFRPLGARCDPPFLHVF